MKQKIISTLARARRAHMSMGEIMKKANISKKDSESFKDVFFAMVRDGEILCKNSKYILTKNLGYIVGEIISVTGKFGFAKVKSETDETQYFIPGRALKGAMVGDTAVLKPIKSRGQSPEAEVVEISRYGKGYFTGVVQIHKGTAYVLPDEIGIPFIVAKGGLLRAEDGEKVLAKVCKRGKRHYHHKAEVIRRYGDCKSAPICALAVLDVNDIDTEFNDEVEMQAEKIASMQISEKDLSYRLDLRDDIIFTIDSADSKDLDDAVSIEKTSIGYILGVHIADVSHYVREKTPLDNEAFLRGTSIYYADKVIPMLPKLISNGICSLNPNEDRLTFSAIIDLDFSGKIIGYRFAKSVIKSRVKGVYSEINSILNNTATSEIKSKYEGLIPTINLMEELADILSKRRFGRGALNLDTTESKIITDENGDVLDILPRERGKSERIIEEFMLTANEAAANFAKQKQIPFVYRIHENPSLDKIAGLCEVLAKLGINTARLSKGATSHALAEILQEVEDTDIEPIVNNQILRSMAKAKYCDEGKGHFGLKLDDYCHFTSPIRRYPDLAIHRILSSLVSDMPIQKMKKRYEAFAKSASSKSTECELRAMKVERDCEDIYKAAYISKYLGEEFFGVISSVAPQGIYVELPNTVEGLVRLSDLPDGNYDLIEGVRYKNTNTGDVYRVGDKVKISVVKADVASGKIDFALAL